MRFFLKDLQTDYEKTEDDIKAVQSVGQIISEVDPANQISEVVCSVIVDKYIGDCGRVMREMFEYGGR